MGTLTRPTILWLQKWLQRGQQNPDRVPRSTQAAQTRWLKTSQQVLSVSHFWGFMLHKAPQPV